MKTAFSIEWKSSKQPRKQRKYRLNAPLHVKSVLLHAPLSKELKVKYNTRSLRVRKGDTVKVLRGQFKGKTSKVQSVDTTRLKLILESISVSKRDGTKSYYPVDPSNVQITAVQEEKRRFPEEKK